MRSGFRSVHFSSKDIVYRYKHIKMAFKWSVVEVIYSETYLSGHLFIRANFMFYSSATI